MIIQRLQLISSSCWYVKLLVFSAELSQESISPCETRKANWSPEMDDSSSSVCLFFFFWNGVLSLIVLWCLQLHSCSIYDRSGLERWSKLTLNSPSVCLLSSRAPSPKNSQLDLTAGCTGRLKARALVAQCIIWMTADLWWIEQMKHFALWGHSCPSLRSSSKTDGCSSSLPYWNLSNSM